MTKMTCIGTGSAVLAAFTTGAAQGDCATPDEASAMHGKGVVSMVLEDVDGEALVEERVGLARATPGVRHDHGFTDPVGRTVEPMRMRGERLDGTVVCRDVHKH